MRRPAVHAPDTGAPPASDASPAAVPRTPEMPGPPRADGPPEASAPPVPATVSAAYGPVRPGRPPWERSARYR